MRTITFRLKPNIGEQEQKKTLTDLRNFEGIVATEQFYSSEEVNKLLRTYYAYVLNEANPDSLLNRIKELPGIESAELEPERYMAN